MTGAANSRRIWLTVGIMLLGVFCYSTSPLAISLTRGGANPFLFSAVWRSGMVVGLAGYLVAGYWRNMANARFWPLLKSYLPRRGLWLTALGYFDLPLFALAARFVDIAVVTILVEISPMLFMLLMQRLDRGHGNYRRIGPLTLFWSLGAFGGFVLVVWGQTGGPVAMEPNGWLHLTLGVMLALGSATVGTLIGFSFRWGRDFGRDLNPSGQSELFGVLLCALLANVLIIPINVLGSLLFLGGASVRQFGYLDAATAFLWGGFFFTVGGVCVRKANLDTRNLGINAVIYARPIFGLLLLWVFTGIEVARLDYLLAGAFLIVVSNLAVNWGGNKPRQARA